MSSEDLGYALIGCGSAGNGHAGYAAATPGVGVVGFCDVHEEAARASCERHGGRYHTTDPERIFADAEVDIVSIATAHDSHKDLAIATLGAGKHLYLEKPMALTGVDAMAVYDAARAAGTKVMMNFSIRFSGAAREIVRRLARPRVCHAQVLMPKGDLSRWRWDPVAGGGPMFDVGVHALDFLCWVTRADPVEVQAMGGDLNHPGELRGGILDTVAATILFGNGGAGQLSDE